MQPWSVETVTNAKTIRSVPARLRKRWLNSGVAVRAMNARSRSVRATNSWIDAARGIGCSARLDGALTVTIVPVASGAAAHRRSNASRRSRHSIGSRTIAIATMIEHTISGTVNHRGARQRRRYSGRAYSIRAVCGTRIQSPYAGRHFSVFTSTSFATIS